MNGDQVTAVITERLEPLPANVKADREPIG